MAHPASGDKCKLYLPSLYIKLGLIKISVKVVCKWNEGFEFLKAKIFQNKWDQDERRDFCLSTNHTIIRRPSLSTKLNCALRTGWTASEHVWRNFLGNEKLENYHKFLRDLISSYGSMGCKMSSQLHFLDSFLRFFLKTWQPSRMNIVKYSIRVF